MTYRTHLNLNDNTTQVGDNSISGTLAGTVQVGDVITAWAVQNTATNIFTITGGGTGAWNVKVDASTISSNHRTYIWTKTAQADAAGSTITINSVGGGGRFVGGVHVESGVTETGMVVSSPAQDSSADTSVDWPDITATSANSHIIIIGTHRSASATAADPGVPTGFTRHVYSNTNTANPNYAASSASRNALAGAGVVTIPDSTASEACADQTWAIAFAPGSVSNVLPTANAGLDQINIEPYSVVTLTGTATDPDGNIASRAWSQISGPTVTLVGTGNVRTFKAGGSIAGHIYGFRYVVTDDDGGVSPPDDMTVTVLPVTERAAIGGVMVPMEVRTA